MAFHNRVRAAHVSVAATLNTRFLIQSAQSVNCLSSFRFKFKVKIINYKLNYIKLKLLLSYYYYIITIEVVQLFLLLLLLQELTTTNSNIVLQ